ncbi:unnamed protein product [Schistocephalus solidus]|uniref:Uncharacterized protein n=1 Tax=Schistocephalus solidus TaxID=70667 RepID=A0A183SQI2_SCHSO|nr:unnamed protein product [Schistocephalus solidus]
MATLANHSTTASRRRALSQINMHAIDDSAICGGCQKLSIKLNQLEDEIRQIKSALKGTSKEVDATQKSTERLTRSKTIDTRSKGILTTTSTDSRATEQQVPMVQEKTVSLKQKNRPKCKTDTKKEKANGKLTSRDSSKKREHGALTIALSSTGNTEIITPSTSSEIDSPTETTTCDSKSWKPWNSPKPKKRIKANT